MRTVVLVACLLAPAAPAAAQDTTPIAELSGGYSVLNLDERTWNGWVASGSVTVTRWFGIEVDGGRNSFTEHYSYSGQTYSYSGNRRFIGAGPRFVGRGRRASAFFHVLIGTEMLFTTDAPSFQAGGGVDVWIIRPIGIRAGADGRHTWYADEHFGSWRWQLGAVFALGSR